MRQPDGIVPAMSEKDPTAAIIDAAQYLRGVRPLDPGELVQYVPEEIHPSAVTDVLRDRAMDLRIRERPDHTFVPVDEGPIHPEFAGIHAFPDRLTAVVEDCLIDAYGEDWYAGTSGDRLRDAIRTFKSAYFEGDPVTYDREAALGYAIYHLPGGYARIQYVLDVLGRAGRLSACNRVLEVGPGVGGVAAGLADYLGEDVPVEYLGIEPSGPALEIADRVLTTTHRNFRWRLERGTIQTADPDGPYDLLLLANVLGELEDPSAVVEPLVELVAEDGSVILLEPADERTSRLLRRVESALVDDLGLVDVFAPTLRLWPNRRPTDACWSFARQQLLTVPPFQRALDEGDRARTPARDPATGEFVNVDVRYAYAILRPDGQRATTYRPARSRVAALGESESHIGDRVNVAVVKLSHSLAAVDAHPLYVIGDGSQDEEHFAVHTRPTSLNEALTSANYGDILEVEGALVLWNEDEHAYNVIVDEETIVDRVPTGIETTRG